MFICVEKLNGNKGNRNVFINPDQVVMFEEDALEKGYGSTIHFVGGKKLLTKKSVKEICEILTECGVEVWR